MNEWFDRYLKGLGAEGVELSAQEAKLVLELAGDAAHTSGARQYAPLATYLAGRAAATSPQEAVKLLEKAREAAREAGPAGGELGVD